MAAPSESSRAGSGERPGAPATGQPLGQRAAGQPLGLTQRLARTDGLRRAALLVWLAVGVVVLGYAAVHILGRPLAVVIPPLLLAVLIVYLLNPVVSGLARRGLPRLAGTALSYIAMAVIVAVLVATLVPLLTRQVASFTEVVPDLGAQLVANLNAMLAALGIESRIGVLDGQEVGDQVQSLLSSEQIRTAAVALLGGLSGLASGAFHLVLVVILGPVIAFYLLVDLPRLSANAWAAMPPDRRTELHEVAVKLGAVVGGFVRGQLLVALFVGTGVTIGLALVGLPFWLLIGLVAGITNIVPLIGPFVAGVLGVTVALFTGGVPMAVLVLIVLTIVQQIDNHLVSPLVMGRTVHIHPLIVLLALLVAATLYGVFGMLVAVPTVAGAKVLLVHLWRTRIPWAAEAGAAAPPEAAAADSGHRPAARTETPGGPASQPGEVEAARRATSARP